MESKVTFTGVRLDGGEDLTTSANITHTDEKGLFVARMRLATMFGSVGGILIDSPDGSMTVHPFSLFKEVKVTTSSIILATSLIQ